MFYVIVMICSTSIPREDCNTHNARAYKASQEQGVICGIGPVAEIAGSAVAPAENEYTKVSCRFRR